MGFRRYWSSNRAVLDISTDVELSAGYGAGEPFTSLPTSTLDANYTTVLVGVDADGEPVDLTQDFTVGGVSR